MGAAIFDLQMQSRLKDRRNRDYSRLPDVKLETRWSKSRFFRFVFRNAKHTSRFDLDLIDVI